MTKKEIENHTFYKAGFEAGKQHAKPSPETEQRLSNIESILRNCDFVKNDELKEMQESFKAINHALLGDPITGEVGLITKTNELYELLTQGKGLVSSAKLIILAGALIGAISAIKSMLK